MSILNTPRSVFVPFEVQGKKEIKRDDLPRFLDPQEVIEFLAAHPGVSSRNGYHVILEWREHVEKELINEYLAGVSNSIRGTFHD